MPSRRPAAIAGSTGPRSIASSPSRRAGDAAARQHGRHARNACRGSTSGATPPRDGVGRPGPQRGRRRRPRGLPPGRPPARDGPGRPPRCRPDWTSSARRRSEAQATDLVDDLARRLAAAGTSLTESVALFVAARRPFLAELAGLGRRRALDAARLAALYEDASSLLDRLLLRLIATHQAAELTWTPAIWLPGTDVHPGPAVRGAAVRPVARPARRVPADLGVRDAVLRHRRRRRGAGRHGRLERGALSDVVPDRRGLDGRLAGPRDGVPAGAHPVRLQLRAVPVPGRAVHVPHPEQARVPGRRHAAAAVLHRRRPAGAGGRGRDLLQQRSLAARWPPRRWSGRRS